MFASRKGFGEEVGKIMGVFPPLDVEVSLGNTVPDPMEAHVDGLKLFGLHRVSGNANGTSVIAEHERGRLRVPESDQDGTNPLPNAAIGE